MKISVVVPTFNRAQVLKDAIQSVLNQTHQNFEIIIVDDHSTDNTIDVVSCFKDQRIKYFKNERKKGAQGARNTGLYYATADWIALLDSDDVWLPNKLETQIRLVNEQVHRDVAGVGCGLTFHDFDRKVSRRTHIPSKSSFDTKELLYENVLGGFSTFIFKKDKAYEVGGFDENFESLQDMEMYIGLSMVGNVLAIQESLVLIRTSCNNRISFNYEKKLSGAKNIYFKYSSCIDRYLAVKCRTMCRIFIFDSLVQKKISLKYVGWVAVSAIFDFKSFTWVFKRVFKLLRIK